MTHEKRIVALEKRLGVRDCGEANPMARPRNPEVVAVLDEYSGMRAMMSDKSYWGSPNGLVKIEPRDVAQEFYGDYTQREFLELAVVRALEGLGYPDEKIDERLSKLVEMFAMLAEPREGDS